MINIAITGGAGFIGSRLAAQLHKEFSVSVFDNLHPQVHDGNPENLEQLKELGIPVITGDVRHPDELRSFIAEVDPDIIYHLAAETGTGQSYDCPARYNAVNIMGTAHLIEAIRDVGQNVKRIILAGSRAIYGEGACVDDEGQLVPAVSRTDADLNKGDYAPKSREGIPLKNVPTNSYCVPSPASIYASTKLMQEYLLQQAFWGTEVSVGILRLQNVFGPGQSLNNAYTGVISIFAKQIQEGKILNIYEDGIITRDFVLVDDVARAFVKMATIESMPTTILDIGSGEATTILDMARRLLSLHCQPEDKLVITGDYRPGDVRYAVADIASARKELDWEPEVSFDEGLKQLVEWSLKANMVT